MTSIKKSWLKKRLKVFFRAAILGLFIFLYSKRVDPIFMYDRQQHGMQIIHDTFDLVLHTLRNCCLLPRYFICRGFQVIQYGGEYVQQSARGTIMVWVSIWVTKSIGYKF